jgi:hypothetical protein
MRIAIGSGETEHTTAHISNILAAGYREIEIRPGGKGVKREVCHH